MLADATQIHKQKYFCNDAFPIPAIPRDDGDVSYQYVKLTLSSQTEYGVPEPFASD